jgi:hypothetical protein
MLPFDTLRHMHSTRGFSTCDPERQGVLCAARPIAIVAGTRPGDERKPSAQRGFAPGASRRGGTELGVRRAGSVGP